MSTTPTQRNNRIQQLDILRGFALLGILIMNLISFGMPSVHYLHPTGEGALSTLDQASFLFSELFANEKFMGLFSILFGAGVVLFTERIERKEQSPAKLHYRRNAWLMLFGLSHAYLLWYGDVLVIYALCSIWLFFARKWNAKTLFIASGIGFFLLIAFNLLLGLSIPYWTADDLQLIHTIWNPPTEQLALEMKTMQGSWLAQMPYRTKTALSLHTDLLPLITLRATSMMLLGMGLYKTGILNGNRSSSWYKHLSIFGLILGVLIGSYGIWQNQIHEWNAEFSLFLGSQYRTLASIPMVLGYIGGVLWLCHSKLGPLLERWLAPVGRMALTNYLTQTILCTTLMYGHGFGWFGTLGRAELWLIIIPIWIIQIFWSQWWMKQFRFGPFEWLWRSLTYWKLQPFKRSSRKMSRPNILESKQNSRPSH